MKKFFKGAIVLLIAVTLLLTTAVSAETIRNTHAINLTSEPTNIVQPEFETSGRAILWDQYDTDGSNGLSHMDLVTAGIQRDLLDDFEIPVGETWVLTDLHSLNLWNTMQPGVGTDFYLEFWSDAGGVPGASLVTALTVSYTETATGRTWFTRPEFEIEYVYEPITLNEGRHWIYGHVVGPENCFWMARDETLIWGSECWTDYADMPPMGPGSVINVDPFDLAFQLTGELEQPGEPLICCDPMEMDWDLVQPGATVNGSFHVWNCGDPGTTLNWKVDSWPIWMEDGGVVFTPSTGSEVHGGPGTQVNFTFTAPSDINSNFAGTVKVINLDDPSDYCEMDTTLVTPRNRGILFNFLEYIVNQFPMLKALFGF